MIKLTRVLGDIVGALGVILCLASGLARVIHIWSVAGLQIPTLFNLGVAMMVFACLAKLHVLTSRN